MADNQGAVTSERHSSYVSSLPDDACRLMFAKAVEALADHLRQAGYQVLLGISDYDRAREEDLVLAVLGRKPDAILVTGVTPPRTRRRLAEAGIPVVEAWDLTRTPIDTVVGFSHEEAGRAIGRLLLGRNWW